MIPILDTIYAIDIETKPKEIFETKKIKYEKAALYPWCNDIYGIGVCWGDDKEKDCKFFTPESFSELLNFICKNNLRLVGHNIFFDWVNLFYKFGLKFNFVADSGVYSQAINNSDSVISFGLKQTTERLYNIKSHEHEIKDYLKTHYKIAGSKYGEFIHLCPTEIIEKYCKLDAYYSRKICIDAPQWMKSDISLYMQLYVVEVKLTMMQFINGILLDTEGFIEQKIKLQSEIDEIEKEFLTHPELINKIEEVQKETFQTIQNGYKTKKLDYLEWKKSNKFNINSVQQLKSLFDKQKLHFNEKTGKFDYPFVNNFPNTKVPNPNSPKLGIDFLYSYGMGGEILVKRGTKGKLIQHIDAILNESSLDGRIHPHTNLLGTKSGRISSSGANLLAAPLKSKNYGSYLITDPDHFIITSDFVALEPSILAALSDDPLLKYICYDGIGKEPFLKDGVLYISDVYISSAYASSFMRAEIESKIDLNNWVKDPEGEKKKIYIPRSLSKLIFLATQYSAGPLKIQSSIHQELGILVPIQQIKDFQNSLWANIPKAYTYKQSLEYQAKSKGFLINIGGFPLIFYNRIGGIIEGTHKALNRMIQSSAAVVMKLLNFYLYGKLLKTKLRFSPLLANIHDAQVFKVHKDSLEGFKECVLNALEDVNNTLSWSIKLRLSINTGSNFYDAQ